MYGKGQVSSWTSSVPVLRKLAPSASTLWKLIGNRFTYYKTVMKSATKIGMPMFYTPQLLTLLNSEIILQAAFLLNAWKPTWYNASADSLHKQQSPDEYRCCEKTKVVSYGAVHLCTELLGKGLCNRRRVDMQANVLRQVSELRPCHVPVQEQTRPLLRPLGWFAGIPPLSRGVHEVICWAGCGQLHQKNQTL